MFYDLFTKFITNDVLRLGCTFGTAFFVSLATGAWLIYFFHKKNVIEDTTQPDHAGLNAIQSQKKNVPTMGGLMILAGIVASTLLWADLRHAQVWTGIMVLLILGCAGFVDDYIKLKHKPSRGLTKTQKLVIQFILGGAVGFLLKSYWETTLPTKSLDGSLVWQATGMNDFWSCVRVPFVGCWCQLGWGYIPWCGFVMAATSNAVNLTDGLDGLAGSLTFIAAITFVLIACVLGLWLWTAGPHYVNFLLGKRQTVLIAAAAGAVLGFLWYNCHPAQIFMGDTGSLALGGLLAFAGLAFKAEAALLVVGGVFFIEELTVAMQIVSFKLTKKRIFPITPIHHYFQLNLKWPEQKIVARACLAGVLFAVLAFAMIAARWI